MNQLPFVTVVIPALNEARVIGDCLRGLAEQTYPRDRFVAVVVDNGSTDGTAALAAELGARVLHADRRSAYVARNTAIEATTGDYLAFTDADCVPHPRWIETLISTEIAAGTGVVAGHITYEPKFDSLGNRMLISSRSPETVRTNVCVHHCAPTGNVMIRRELLERYGVFLEITSGSDIEMSRRLAGHGHPPEFAEGAVVSHQCDLTNFEYLRRSFRINRGHALHDAAGHAWGRLIADAAQVPWRPGFRSVQPVREAIAEYPPSPFLATWLYIWSARLCGYAGRLDGRLLGVLAAVRSV